YASTTAAGITTTSGRAGSPGPARGGARPGSTCRMTHLSSTCPRPAKRSCPSGPGHEGASRRLAGWGGTWPAGPAHGSDLAGQPPGVGQGTAQEELDLGVGAAQLVGGPPGQGVVDRRVQAQQETLALAHVVTVPALTGTGSRC